MFEFLPLLLVVLLLIGGLFLARQNTLKKRRVRQFLGLSWLQTMKDMMSNIQRHRGLSGAYLNGDKTLLPEIESLQRTIGRDVSAVENVGSWVVESDRWLGINEHWARLSGNLQRHSSDSSFNQHNLLIKNILYLIDDMSLHHNLLSLTVQDNKPFYLLWRDLLSASEFIGQARALGTAVAVKGECDSVARIKLNFLCQKIDGNTQSVWQRLDVSDRCVEGTESLIETIKTQIVMDRVALSSAEYFEMASRVMNNLHDEYDALVESVRWRLNE